MRYRTHYHTPRRNREAWEIASQSRATYGGHSGFDIVERFSATVSAGLSRCEALEAVAKHFQIDPETVHQVVSI